MSPELKIKKEQTSDLQEQEGSVSAEGGGNGDICAANVAKAVRWVTKHSHLFTARQRQEIAEAVTGPVAVRKPASGAAKRLCAELRLADDGLLQDRQIIELVRILVNFVVRLEPVLEGTWRKLHPASNLHLPRGFDRRVRQFLATDHAPELSVRNELEGMQVFIGAFLAAVARAGDGFADRFTAEFSPEAILGGVEGEQAGFLRMLGMLIGSSKKERCWDRYCGQSDRLYPGSIKARIHRDIAGDVESFIQSMIKTAKKRKG